MAIVKVLSGHTSPETAYHVEDYPYGFRLRCRIRYWVETKRGLGQRVVSQTTNPKKPGTVWNTPKASTYSLVRVLFLDEKEHVQNAGLSPYADLAEVESFEQTYAEGLTDRDRDFFVAYKQAIERRRQRVAAEKEAKQIFGTEDEAVQAGFVRTLTK